MRAPLFFALLALLIASVLDAYKFNAPDASSVWFTSEPLAVSLTREQGDFQLDNSMLVSIYRHGWLYDSRIHSIPLASLTVNRVSGLVQWEIPAIDGSLGFDAGKKYYIAITRKRWIMPHHRLVRSAQFHILSSTFY
jgi:hypothetical protein